MIIWTTRKNDEFKVLLIAQKLLEIDPKTFLKKLKNYFFFFLLYNASREISFGTETYVDVAAAQIKEHCRSMGLNKRNAVHLYFIGCPF